MIWLRATAEICVEISELMPKERAIDLVKMQLDRINRSCNEVNALVQVLPSVKAVMEEGAIFGVAN